MAEMEEALGLEALIARLEELSIRPSSEDLAGVERLLAAVASTTRRRFG